MLIPGKALGIYGDLCNYIGGVLVGTKTNIGSSVPKSRIDERDNGLEQKEDRALGKGPKVPETATLNIMRRGRRGRSLVKISFSLSENWVSAHMGCHGPQYSVLFGILLAYTGVRGNCITFLPIRSLLYPEQDQPVQVLLGTGPSLLIMQPEGAEGNSLNSAHTYSVQASGLLDSICSSCLIYETWDNAKNIKISSTVELVKTFERIGKLFKKENFTMNDMFLLCINMI